MLDTACHFMFCALDKNAKKAEMALDLLYSVEPSTFKAPHYIAEGLNWLEKELINSSPLAAKSEAKE